MAQRHFESTVDEDGQVTIPAEVRRQLRLKPNDRVLFTVDDGVILLARGESRIAASYGAVTPRQRPEDFAALREEFEEGVAEAARQY